MADTVLIAAPEHLATLKANSSYAGAQAFPDGEALKALEVITREKPKLIVLERTFAATSRGAALIKRIKADPALVRCDIKIVAPDAAPPSPPRDEMSSSAKQTKSDDRGSIAPAPPKPAPAVPAPAPKAAPAPPPLDQRGTRRAPRFIVVKGIEVLIDGKPATLINVSVVGAQVVSQTVLRPNQRVRMVLPDRLAFPAGIAWAAFEMPKTGPQYRAGIEFFDAETESLDRFIEANKA